MTPQRPVKKPLSMPLKGALVVLGFLLLALVLRLHPAWRLAILELLEHAGPWWGFGVFSIFYNVLLIPFPYDVFLLATPQIYSSQEEILWASVVGCAVAAIVDYLAGYFLADRVRRVLARDPRLLHVEQWLHSHGPMAVAFSAVTPVPFSLVCWGAGMVRASPLAVVALAVLARGARNALVLWLAWGQ